MSNYAKYKDLGDTNTSESFNSIGKRPHPPKNNSNSNSNSNNSNRSNFNVYEIKSEQDKLNIVNNNKVCVIDVWGEGCSPCKAISPLYADLASQYTNPGKCVLVKENSDLRINKPVEIRGVPTFQFFKDGVFLSEYTIMGGGGKKQIEKIQETIDELLSI